MLEGGYIINMLDEDVLKDICFHSHQFSNDANGKMLLGMLFVFSKQYSDDLSDKVSRGVEGNFKEGKSAGAPKWGYDRDEVTGRYEPNDWFETIQQAWLLREQGQTIEQVTQFLLDKGFHRVTKNKKNPKIIKPVVNTVAKMFRDPFYYGVLVQTNQTVDMRLIYDFKPMIKEDVFNRVQVLGYGRTKSSSKKRSAFYPLRGMVYCAVCNDSKHMLVGKNKTGSGSYVLSYRCDNPACTRNPKSLRAKHVFNSIYERLEKFELTDEAYQMYSKRLDSMTDAKIIDIKTEVMSLRGSLAHVKNEVEQRALSIAKYDRKDPIWQANNKRITELSLQQADIEQKVQKLVAKIADPQKIKLTKEQFLNVIKTAADKMKAGSPAEKDALCRILFLNLRVDNEKVVEYLWKEPFASLVKATELSSGRGDRI